MLIMETIILWNQEVLLDITNKSLKICIFLF